MFWYVFCYRGHMSYAREVFANAPLAFVACEIRFPLAPKITGDGSLQSLTEVFVDTLPIPEVATFRSIPEMDALGDPERQLRFLNKERTTSVAVTRNSLVVETTDYVEWEYFKPLVLEAVRAVQESVRIVGAERVGLRYIDEIRVPDKITDVSGWTGWINNNVLSHLDPMPGYTTESFQTVIELSGPGGQIVVRYTALDGAGVVSGEPLKRRSQTTEGPFFVIDTDSYRDVPGTEMLSFSPEVLAPVLDELHEPVGAMFQNAITDKSRALFRGEL